MSPGRLGCLLLLLFTTAVTTQAQAVFNVGSFTKSTGAAPVTQTINHGLGVTPKAIIFWMEGSTSAGSFGANYRFSFGMTDGTRSRSAATASQDNVATANCSRRMADKALTIVQWGETTLAEADLQSWNSTSFTLNWTTNNNQGYVVHFLAIGGADVLARVVGWTMPTATGNVAVTGVGFQPDVVFHAHTGSGFTSALPANQIHAGFGLGVMDLNGNQWSNTIHNTDGISGSDTQRAQRTDAALVSINSGLTFTKIGSFLSMDNDGFTLNFGTVNSLLAGQVVSLALQGLSFRTGSFNKATGAAPVNQAITGVGFKPSVMLFSSFMDTTQANAVAHTRWGIGASNVTTEGSVACVDTNAVNPTQVDRVAKTTKAFMKVNAASPTAVNAEADLNSLDTDGFTLRWTTNDNVATEILYLALAPLSATAVKMKTLAAQRTERGTRLEWRTGHEVDNLGFNVWRESNGRRERLTPSLIGGSALLAGPGRRLAAGKLYQWLDDLPDHQAATAYWIEDVDLHGARTWHGPLLPQRRYQLAQSLAKDATISSPPLSRLGAVAAQRETASLNDPPARQREISSPSNRRIRSFSESAVDAPAEESALQRQRQLAAGQAVKIEVRRDGWYRLRQADLLAAGLDATLDPRQLQLYLNGQEQAMLVSGEDDGRFDAADAIEFYGVALDTPSTATNLYWLIAGTARGQRVRLDRAAGRVTEPVAFPRRRGGGLNGNSGGVQSFTGKQSFPATVERRDRTIYFESLRNGDAENFFGPVIAMEPVEQSLLLRGVETAATDNATLEISLQGVTGATEREFDHYIRVQLNGHNVGELKFNGQKLETAQFSLSHSWLREGSNVVRFVGSGSEVDVTLLAAVRLTFQRKFVAANDELQFSLSAGEHARLDGFTSAQVRVFDLTEPDAITELQVTAEASANGFAANVRATRTGTRRLLALTAANIRHPETFYANQASRWHEANHNGEVVMIAPRFLLPALTPLKAWREAQGRSVVTVAVEDLYDEFNFGAKRPEAIKDFLRRATETWQQKPRFVLLVGDATYDPRNYLGQGEYDLIPTKLLASSFQESASDDWLADFDGDAAPELALGRLPVRSFAEAEKMIARIINYEQGAQRSANDVLIVADEDEIFDFEAASAQLRALIPDTMNVQEVKIKGVTGATARSEILTALNNGPRLANFLGHGAPDGWSQQDLFTAADANALTNGQKLSFYVAMTCLNGYFHDVYAESLAETLLNAPNGGAIAVWTSAGVVNVIGQEQLNEALFRTLFSNPSLTIGEAVQKAKQSIANRDLRRTWVLLGDPATRLR